MTQLTQGSDMDEYIKLRYTSDPIEAFNLFVKRNVDPSLHAHFADSDDNEAEFVRRTVQRSIDRAVAEAEAELLDLAIEVIYQWGYKRSPGEYTSGGLSTLEFAFAVLKRHGKLDKDGYFVPEQLSPTTTEEKEVK